ncbi:MAG: hypothetical protein PHW02_01085 [bacterium]|nr:hypothetical protein [bacterium]
MKEPLYVITLFSDGKIKPIYFIWNNRRLKIENITYNWRTVDENGINQHFSVISGSFYYHLLFVTSMSRWYLTEVESTLA